MPDTIIREIRKMRDEYAHHSSTMTCTECVSAYAANKHSAAPLSSHFQPSQFDQISPNKALQRTHRKRLAAEPLYS